MNESMNEKIICSIYRSSRHEGMYLFVDKREGLTRVDEQLSKRFGKAVHAMDLLLHPERKLAHAEIGEVMIAIREKGFYLQLPPTDDDLLATPVTYRA